MAGISTMGTHLFSLVDYDGRFVRGTPDTTSAAETCRGYWTTQRHNVTWAFPDLQPSRVNRYKGTKLTFTIFGWKPENKKRTDLSCFQYPPRMEDFVKPFLVRVDHYVSQPSELASSPTNGTI